MHIIGGDFDPRRLPIDDAAQIAGYLAKGHGIFVAGTNIPDEIDPSRRLYGIGHLTDGIVIWSANAYYYAREYGIAPPEELLTHVRAQGYRFPDYVPEEALRQARQIVWDAAGESTLS